MSSRTVKWLLLASVLLIAFPVVAGASTARVAGLGIQSDYIKDYTNVFTYLSNVSCVGNLVYGELGNSARKTRTSDRAVGAIIGNLFDGRFGTVGVRLSEETPQLGGGEASTGVDSADPNTNASHAFDLMWGKKLGTMNLGLRLNRSYAHAEGDPTYTSSWNEIGGDLSLWSGVPSALNYWRNILGFGAGVGYELSPKLAVEASMLYQSRTFVAQDTLYDQGIYSQAQSGLYPTLTPGQKYENDGSGAYLMALRGLYQVKPELLIVPVFKYYSIKADISRDQTVPTGIDKHTIGGADDITADSLVGLKNLKYTTLEDQSSGFQLGVAGNWTINQNDLLVLGATIESFKRTEINSKCDSIWYRGETRSIAYSDPYVETEVTTTTTTMPAIFAALEMHVNPWLTLRLGAKQGVFCSTKTENAAGTTYTHDVTGQHVPTSSLPTETTRQYSPFTMEVGAGFKFGTLQVDATLNPDFVHNGPYLISGETTSGMFPKVSATYTF